MGPALACYFRRSYFLGREKIPKNGPLVVISNHAASFLDAMLMGVMLDRPIHYYARGDIFQKKWARYIFGQLHMIPLFSADLAKDQLHRNADSFTKGEEVLKKGGLLLIFPEGVSRLERNMLPLKKGVSRIILQALSSDEHMKINVVPIGIHYSKHAFLSDVQLVAGEPIDVSSFRNVYEENGPKAVNELTQELDKKLREVMLYVAQDERSDLIERQLTMLDNERRGRYSKEDFNRQYQLCRKISSLDEHTAHRLQDLHKKYDELLKEHELNDEVVAGRKNLVIPSALLLLSSPLFVLGVLVSGLPILFGKRTADTKVTRADFYTSVLTAVSAMSFVLWMLILLITALLLDNIVLFLIVMFAPMLTWFAIRWWEHFCNWKFRKKYRKLLRTSTHIQKNISALRTEIRTLASNNAII
jgi:1-acyl-sn-glycerol-3-phosphate acyltransferase